MVLENGIGRVSTFVILIGTNITILIAVITVSVSTSADTVLLQMFFKTLISKDFSTKSKMIVFISYSIK